MTGPGESALFLGLGATIILVGLFIQLLVNSCAMWFVMNRLMAEEYKAGFLKCMWATFLLTIVLCVAPLCLLIPLLPCFITFPLVFIVWYMGSIAVLQGVFEMVKGALTVLVLFIMVNIAIGFLISVAFG